MITPHTLHARAHSVTLITGGAIGTLLVSGLLVGTMDAWEWRTITLLALWPVFVVAAGTLLAVRAFRSVGEAYQHGVEVGRGSANVHRLGGHE